CRSIQTTKAHHEPIESIRSYLFSSVDGFELEGMGEDKGRVGGLASIREPAPAEHAVHGRLSQSVGASLARLPLIQGAHQVVQLCPGVFARNSEAKVAARRAARIMDKGGIYSSAEERLLQDLCFTLVARNKRHDRTGCWLPRKTRSAQRRFEAVHVALQT